jgi:hypothetical protein
MGALFFYTLIFAESSVTNWTEIIFGGIFEVAAAVVGGLIALGIARKTISSALKHEKDKAQAAARNSERSFLLSIQAELEGLFKIYQLEVEGISLDKLPDGEGLYYHLPLSQNYFSVFESNAASLGIIEDDKLRKQIITTYLCIKALVGCHLYNNQLLEVRDRYLEKVAEDDGVERFQSLLDQADADIRDYGSTIRNTYQAAVEAYEAVFANLDNAIEALTYKSSEDIFTDLPSVETHEADEGSIHRVGEMLSNGDTPRVDPKQ